jgi:uncharacterized phage protein gp47/JayE
MPLPDYMEPLDEATVLERMLARPEADLDRSQGSFLYDPLAAAALEFVLAGDRLQTIFEMAFAETTFGEWLDLRAAEHGVVRLPATAATGQVTFTGTNGTLIPGGTEVSTAATEGVDAQSFITDADVTIAGGEAIAAVTAALAGTAGNVGAGAIQVPVDVIAGVTGVTNAAGTTGGTDEETDADLLERLLFKVRNPGTSGNIADYVTWALEAHEDVGGAAVVPLEGGAGTVTVALIDDDGQPSAAPVVTAVQNYIAPGGSNAGTGKAPIGAAVTVEAADDVVINVAADLTIEAGYNQASVEAAVTEAVAAYLREIAFATDNDVRIAKVTTAIIDTPGVADATTVTLNGGTSNITITTKQVGVLGPTTWT